MKSGVQWIQGLPPEYRDEVLEETRATSRARNINYLAVRFPSLRLMIKEVMSMYHPGGKKKDRPWEISRLYDNGIKGKRNIRYFQMMRHSLRMEFYHEMIDHYEKMQEDRLPGLPDMSAKEYVEGLMRIRSNSFEEFIVMPVSLGNTARGVDGWYKIIREMEDIEEIKGLKLYGDLHLKDRIDLDIMMKEERDSILESGFFNQYDFLMSVCGWAEAAGTEVNVQEWAIKAIAYDDKIS
jgi:uncharacterized protein YqgQ